jgi:bisphosphoglycerate-dependent phosphoglycerate mutase
LVIEGVDGPPKKLSTTVVVRYRVANPEANTGSTGLKEKLEQASPVETPEEWALRVTGKLCGLMKDEIAAMGGGEAFLRWVRGYDEEDAP